MSRVDISLFAGDKENPNIYEHDGGSSGNEYDDDEFIMHQSIQSSKDSLNRKQDPKTQHQATRKRNNILQHQSLRQAQEADIKKTLSTHRNRLNKLNAD